MSLVEEVVLDGEDVIQLLGEVPEPADWLPLGSCGVDIILSRCLSLLAIKYSYSALIGGRQYSIGGHTMVAPAPLLHVQLTPQCINTSLRCSQIQVSGFD